MSQLPANSDGMDFNAEHDSAHASRTHHAAGRRSSLRGSFPNVDFLSAISSALNGMIVWVIGLMAFAVPFVFANWTVEYVRYNKVTLVVIAAAIVLVLWAIKALVSREFRLKRTVLDIPVLAFLGVATLAFVVSKVGSQSLWGTFPNFEDSFILTASGIFFFYALVNHIRGARDWLMLVGLLMSSAALLAIVTILQYWGVYLLPFSSISHNRLFSPFGTVFQVGFFLAVLLPFVNGFFVGSLSNKRWVLSALVGVTLVGSLIVFGIVQYWPIWLVAAFGTVVSTLVSIPVLSKGGRSLSYVAFVPLALLLLSAAIFWIPALRNTIPQADLVPQKPIVLDVSSSLKIARESMSEFALLGAGQGNYGYAYKVLRPTEFNQQNDWILNYNRPANQLFMVFTTMGVLGLAVLVGFLGYLLIMVVRALIAYSLFKEADPAVIGLFVSLAAYVLVLILSWETIPLLVLFWVLLVLAVYIGFEPEVSGIKGDKVFALKMSIDAGRKELDLLSIVAGVAGIIVSGVLLYNVLTVYAVDMNLRNAIDAGNNGDTNASLVAQNKVVTAKEAKDYHLRGVAILLHNQGIAAELSQDNEEQRATDVERKRAYFREAVRFARLATTANALDSQNWEVLLGIYSTLAQYGINKIDQVPLSNIMAEIRTQLATLSPTEVTWRIRMANYFVGAQEWDNAISLLGQANQLKSNLVDIHYLAAKTFGGAKDYANAIVEANLALRSLAADNVWTEELNTLITEWKQAQEAAAGTTTTPTTTTPETTTPTTPTIPLTTGQ